MRYLKKLSQYIMIFDKYDLMYFVSNIMPTQSIVSLGQVNRQTQEIVKTLILEKYANATRHVLNHFTSCRLQKIDDNVIYNKTIILLMRNNANKHQISKKYRSLIDEHFATYNDSS